MNRIQFAVAATAACALALPAAAASRPHPDHHEFEATLFTPYQGAPRATRELELDFSFPDGEALLAAAWRVRLVDARGTVLRVYYGETALQAGAARQTVRWEAPTGEGFYTLELAARAIPLQDLVASSGEAAEGRIERFLARPDGDRIDDRTEVRVGTPPAPKLQPFPGLHTGAAAAPARFARGRSSALAAGPDRSAALAAPGSLPYTIVLANLHSQTNHSDGGGDVATCGGAETPWAGQFGPTDAWEMMRTQAGGDVLLTSEHNHMYDGSTGTDGAASPAHAHDLFNGGLQAAASYTQAHPGFLALYGTEWGVISGGGHLNILNPDGLASWESSASGALFGDVFTPKSEYAPIYATMKARGWIGQFNHPQPTGQFQIGGVPLAYDANGDEVMALCEVNNTNAFSRNLTETETSRPNYEAAFNKLLEAGYHVAPTTDQDNHCANWGLSYTNRTGVLLPEGTALTRESFLAAIRARHVFATMDKRSQLVLATGSGAIMGDRVGNGGPLTLRVLWSTTGAHAVSRVLLIEGVPGRNGSPTQLADGLTDLTIFPSAGRHYYYAVVTEDNGDKLWSAPIWVDQSASGVSARIDQPAADQTVDTGTTVVFAGSATSTNGAIVSGSWSFGDGATADGFTASHTYLNSTFVNATYVATFTAFDTLGGAASASRSIVVRPDATLNSPPAISAIGDVSAARNTPVTVNFTVGDAQTPAALLEVAAAASNAVLLPAGSLSSGGSGSARSLTLTPAPGRIGSSLVTVTVTDGGGATASATFTLTVLAGEARLIISQYYEGLSNNKWIEITNVGDGPYDPATGRLYLSTWFNPATAGTTFTIDPINAVLQPGGSILFRASAAVLPAASNLTGPVVVLTSAGQFNGDDITFLTPVATAGPAGYAARIDTIGVNDPSWTASGGSGIAGGQDRSYVRNRQIVAPSQNYVPSQWTRFLLADVNAAAAGTTQRLGEHAWNHAPTIEAIPDQTLYSGQSLGPIDFSVGDAETAAASLTITAFSSDETLVQASSIAIGGAGPTRSLSITPVADQSGSTAITLVVSDGEGRTAASAFLLTVLPSAVTGVTLTPRTAYLHAGRQQQFTAAVQGVGAFSQDVLWTATGGTSDGNGLYTPPLDGGPFTVTATSAQDPSFFASATVTTNGAPVAVAAAVATLEDRSMDVTLAATDADGDALVFAVVTSPLHGTLSGTGPKVIYTPDADFNGEDRFTFSASDGFAPPSSAVVSIHVEPVNDAPVAENASVATDEDTPVTIQLSALDVEGDALSFQVVGLPGHGTVTLAGSVATYVPAPDWNGTDAFSFVADDGQLLSNVANIRIVVAPVNDAPVASSQSLATLEDTAVAITLSGTDTERDALSFAVVRVPEHGVLSGTPPSLVYTPAPDWNGTDSFTFVANDGQADSNLASVRIAVAAVNDAPVAASSTVSTNEDVPAAVPLLAGDVEGDSLSYTIVSAPRHGTLSGTAPNLVYTPAPDWSGTDSFTWTASDGQLSSAPATVTVRVAVVNDAPVAAAQDLSTRKNRPLLIVLSATDVEGDALTFRIVRQPAHGSLIGFGRLHLYLPRPSFTGDDSLAFVANDGRIDSAPAEVRITVTRPNPRLARDDFDE